MPDSCALVWLRRDLRVGDNPALHAAARSGRPVICVYVLDDETPGRWNPGRASRWWLHYSLRDLRQTLAKKGGTLILRRGRADREILLLAREVHAAEIYWNRCYEPSAAACEMKLLAASGKKGVSLHRFDGSLLHRPESLLPRSGAPYKVFSAFWRALLQGGEPDSPLPALKSIPAPPDPPTGERLDDWALLPSDTAWARGLRETWAPGEEGAKRRLAGFLDRAAARYDRERDRPDVEGTSFLSPHLHFGEISPRTIWMAARSADLSRDGPSAPLEKFLSELGWREFSYYLLHHFPRLPDQSLRPEFRNFPWAADSRLFGAWTRGETGYPLVDAGMRQLRQTGWMHNRVRMNAASLLVKHLLQPWQDGAAWFWDMLVDADLASNSVNWQWIAGCGPDAAPWFRIFNPVLQGERFDPHGNYVRRFLPELAKLPDSHIHRPWEAPPAMRERAGVRLDRDYPRPVVDLRKGRERALAAFAAARGAPSPSPFI